MLKLFYFLVTSLFLCASCHWVVDSPLPDRSINFLEQINHEGSEELLNNLLDTNHIEKVVLTVAPPSAFLKEGKFENYLKNQSYLFSLKEKDTRVEIVCTYDPRDKFPTVQSHLEYCFDRGAIGVKTFHTHSMIANRDFKKQFLALDQNFKTAVQVVKRNKGVFYLFSNDPSQRIVMLNYLNEQGVPVVCSHFCFSGNSLIELSLMMDKFPNLYVGYSFLSPRVFYQFLSNNKSGDVKAFFQKYSTRILYESSVILDDNGVASKDYIYWCSRNQFEYLSKEKFSFFAPPFLTKAENFNGLNLDKSIVEAIYYKNGLKLFDRFSNSR